MLYSSRITDATVDAFATCGFNVRMRNYASCGPRLSRPNKDSADNFIIYNIIIHTCLVELTVYSDSCSTFSMIVRM